MRSDKIIIDPIELKWLYINGNKTIKSLMKFYKCSEGTISLNLRAFGLQKRFSKKDRLHLSREMLYELYYTQQKGVIEISKKYHMAPETLQKLFDKYGFKKRTLSDSIKIGYHTKIGTSDFQKHIAKIREQYQHEKLTHAKACKLISCDFGTELLKHICDIHGFWFPWLINSYRRLEKIIYKVGVITPSHRVRVALILYYKYDLPQRRIAKIAGATEVSFRGLRDKLRKWVKVDRKLQRVDPTTIVPIHYIINGFEIVNYPKFIFN